MATITINGVTLDPSAQAAGLRSAKLLSADAHDSDYVLVQTKGPLSKEQRAALEKTGAKILEFVPQDTYVCHYPGTDLKKIRALPFVMWVNTYLRDFKINPALIPRRIPGPGAASWRPTLRRREHWIASRIWWTSFCTGAPRRRRCAPRSPARPEWTPTTSRSRATRSG